MGNSSDGQNKKIKRQNKNTACTVRSVFGVVYRCFSSGCYVCSVCVFRLLSLAQSPEVARAGARCADLDLLPFPEHARVPDRLSRSHTPHTAQLGSHFHVRTITSALLSPIVLSEFLYLPHARLAQVVAATHSSLQLSDVPAQLLHEAELSTLEGARSRDRHRAARPPALGPAPRLTLPHPFSALANAAARTRTPMRRPFTSPPCRC